jgi:hypothetical protein
MGGRLDVMELMKKIFHHFFSTAMCSSSVG